MRHTVEEVRFEAGWLRCSCDATVRTTIERLNAAFQEHRRADERSEGCEPYTERDAYGRKRSSRSIPADKGSRGGHWHELAFRSAYFRAWREAHPEYRERDNQRRRLARMFARLGEAAA